MNTETHTSATQRWLRRPKSLWVRKALFQVHLWIGVALGVYVFVISVSGSAIVFANDLYETLWRGPKLVAIGPHRLSRDELRAAARRAYPDGRVSWIWDAKQPNHAIEIWLDRSGHRKQRLFDPYTGEDLGESRPYSIQFLAWLGDLHTNLLSGRAGRAINGAGAVFVLALTITGAVLWWPGVRTWRSALVIRPQSNWKRMNWQLHSVAGLWMLLFLFMFGVVGAYSVFPKPFQIWVNKIAPLDVYRLPPEASVRKDNAAHVLPAVGPTINKRPRFVRPKLSTGDKIIRWLSYLHFGDFGGWPIKALWVVIGLAPAFLFVTGLIMWWNRVLSPVGRRIRTTGLLRGLRG